jgi:hypothetical protein
MSTNIYPYVGAEKNINGIIYTWNGSIWVETANTNYSFNQTQINGVDMFNSFKTRNINFQGINLVIYSGGVNTLVFSASSTSSSSSSSTFSGGTVSGATNFTNGLSANTIYVTTYQNLPINTLTAGQNINISGTSGNLTISFTGTTGSSFTGGTVSGATRFISGLTANTISATTYQNLPFSGTVNGNGTTNFLPKWTGTTGLGNSQIIDDGTNVGIGGLIASQNFVTIFDTTTATTTSLNVINAANALKRTISASGGQTGVFSIVYSNSDSKSFEGFATNGTNAYGFYGVVSPDENSSITNGIGGYFEVSPVLGYGDPTNKYSLQLKDGTEGLNKVLTSVTSDGKANWSNVLTGLTNVRSTTISATTYQGLPFLITYRRLTSSSTLDSTDLSTVNSGNPLVIEMNVSSGNTITIPPNSAVTFSIGSQITISQYGTGQTTIVAGLGVTLRSSGSFLKLAAQYSMATLMKVGTNEWYVVGQLAP